MNRGYLTLALFTICILVFILGPVIVIVLSSFTTSMFATFPPKGFTLQWYGNIGTYPEFIGSIGISLIIATMVTIVALFFGILASYSIVRHKFPGKNALNAFFMSPISLPWIVIGISLLFFYSRLFRIETLTGLIIGHLLVTTPYMIRSIVASLTGFNRTLEEASLNLGASEVKTFLKITLPLIKPGILSGTIFTFLLSFNDLNISMFLAGPHITPFPLVLFNFLVLRALDPTIAALSSVIALSTIALGVLLGRFFSAQVVVGRK